MPSFKSSKVHFFTLFTCLIILTNSPASAQQVGRLDLEKTRSERMSWFRDAKFGMFIHWGVYSMYEGLYKGAPSPRYGEWILCNSRIPVQDYRDMAKGFNPVKFNPEEWAEVAKGAGMTYMVITSKHHDGFALFDTKASDWGVMNTEYGKDIIGPLKKSVQNAGLRFGVYYSQALDWGNHGANGGAHWDKDYVDYPSDKKLWGPRFDRYLKEVAAPQIAELSKNYGKMDLFWWDMPKDMNDERSQLLADILFKNQPHIINNGRLNGKAGKIEFGDFDTHEQSIPAVPLLDKYWESCMTMNHTWGYRSTDHDWKSTTTLIHNLTGVISKGGNYLLNIGPKPDGTFPQASIDRLREIGEWMKVNKEAVFNTTATPFLFQQAYKGACTQRVDANKTSLFLHVHEWPKDGTLEVLGIGNKNMRAYLLADKDRKDLSITQSEQVLQIVVPLDAPDQHSSTVVLELEGKLKLKKVSNVMTGDGMTLASRDAKITGKKLRYNNFQNGLLDWNNINETASWDVHLNETGRYKVEVYYANNADSKFDLSFGEDQTTLILPSVKNTGLRRKYGKAYVVGEINITQSGSQTVTLKPAALSYKPTNIGHVRFIPLTSGIQQPDGNITLDPISAKSSPSTIISNARSYDKGKHSLEWETTITRQTGVFQAVMCYSSDKQATAHFSIDGKEYKFNLRSTGLGERVSINIGGLPLTQSGKSQVKLSLNTQGSFELESLNLYEQSYFVQNSEKLSQSYPLCSSPYYHYDKGASPDAYSAKSIMDGNSETGWISTLGRGKQWFTLDLGESKTLSKMKFLIEPRNSVKDFNALKVTVEYKGVSGKWEKLPKSYKATQLIEGIDLPAHNARRWKFSFDKGRCCIVKNIEVK